jgi:hypothetical protein
MKGRVHSGVKGRSSRGQCHASGGSQGQPVEGEGQRGKRDGGRLRENGRDECGLRGPPRRASQAGKRVGTG